MVGISPRRNQPTSDTSRRVGSSGVGVHRWCRQQDTANQLGRPAHLSETFDVKTAGQSREISCSHDKLEFLIFVLRSSTSRPCWPSLPAVPTLLLCSTLSYQPSNSLSALFPPTYLPISDKLSFVLRAPSALSLVPDRVWFPRTSTEAGP